MTFRRVRLIAFLFALTPGVARAGTPTPQTCSADALLFGSTSGIGFSYSVTVKRFTNPLPGATVQLVFHDPAVRLLLAQEEGTYVDCATRTLSRMADMQGVAVFHPRLAGYVNAPDVDVRANGIVLRTVPARSTDLDGDGRTNLQDLARFRENLLHAPSAAETDYDGSGTTNGYDLNLFRAEFLRQASGTLCP